MDYRNPRYSLFHLQPSAWFSPRSGAPCREMQSRWRYLASPGKGKISKIRMTRDQRSPLSRRAWRTRRERVRRAARSRQRLQRWPLTERGQRSKINLIVSDILISSTLSLLKNKRSKINLCIGLENVVSVLDDHRNEQTWEDKIRFEIRDKKISDLRASLSQSWWAPSGPSHGTRRL